MLSLPAEIACTRSKTVRRETNLIPTTGGRGGLRWCNEPSRKTGGRRSKPSIDWPWSTSVHGLRFVACLFREPVSRRSRSVDILDTFTINGSGRVADGLCRAPAVCPLPPQFGAILGELWRALTDTQTEANTFSRFALTMSKEGFDISRNRGKDGLEVEATLHIHTSGWRFNSCLPWTRLRRTSKSRRLPTMYALCKDNERRASRQLLPSIK